MTDETLTSEPIAVPRAGDDGEAATYTAPLLSRRQISDRARRGALSIMARGFGVRAMGMVGNIVLARLLLPRAFGMISLGTTIVMFGDFLASGGLGAALVRQPGKIARLDLQAIGFHLVITGASPRSRP